MVTDGSRLVYRKYTKYIRISVLLMSLKVFVFEVMQQRFCNRTATGISAMNYSKFAGRSGLDCLFVCLFTWGLTALSAQIGYIVP